VNTQAKRWLVRDQLPDVSKEISRAHNISPLVSQVLINRGFDTPEKVDIFLSASLKDLYNPFLMKDMEKAVDRVISAIKKKEKICIYGDYDVDGITATSIVVLFLQEIDADVAFHIPNRLTEGYGLNLDTVQKIKRQGVTLIITVDCGISDIEPIEYAYSQGMEVIVTDHHEVPDTVPRAAAILNPKQPGCDFPFKGLAGVGVAFNLIMALRKKLRDMGTWTDRQEPNLKNYLDLVAMGTIADIVPMVDENRIFVRNGLEVLTSGKRPGVEALKSVSGITQSAVTSTMVGYRLAPRINASGRLADAGQVVRLLLCSNSDDALKIAQKVDEENTRRQQIERKILAEAKAMITDENPQEPLILSSAGWHPGVIGLCASRLSEEYYRPSILMAIDEKTGNARGSARSIRGFDIYGAIKSCGSVLKAFGGHKVAAGLTLPVENIELFKKKFRETAKNDLLGTDSVPEINIDAEISLSQLSYDIQEELENLSPFGPSNPEPVFSTHNIGLYSSMVVGKGHLKLKIKENGEFFDAIGFNMASQYNLKDEKIRLVFVPQFHFFNGEKILQLNLKDIKNEN